MLIFVFFELFFRSSLSLPFPEHNAKHYKELQAAVNVVESACRLCVDVISYSSSFPLLTQFTSEYESFH